MQSLAKSAWPEHDTAATEYDVVEGERAQVHADEDMVPGHSHSHTHVSVREEAGEEVLDATVDDQSHDKDNSTIDDREAGCIQAEAGCVVAEAGCVAAEPGCAEAEVESELERSGDYAASDLDDSMRIGDELADSNDTYPESIAETSWGGTTLYTSTQSPSYVCTLALTPSAPRNKLFQTTDACARKPLHALATGRT